MQQAQSPGQYDQAPTVSRSGPYGQPYGAPQPPMGGGGSFLGTAAAAAAGMVGGSLLLGSIRSMMGGSRHGFGDTERVGRRRARARIPGAINPAAISRATPGSTISAHRPIAPTTLRAPDCSIPLDDDQASDDDDDRDDMDLDSDDFGDDGDSDYA